jgi:hypothetical protein
LKTELQNTTKVVLLVAYGTKVPFLEGLKMPELKDVELPTKIDDLIKLLNEVYPEKSPIISNTPTEIYFQAGQRDVVKFINMLKERTQK